MKLRIERLEERTLLAADISVVQVDGEPGAVGEEVTRWIRVYSDEAAEVNVNSVLTNELENPRWQRFDTYGNEFGSVSDGGETILDFPGVAAGQQIGDFNGDHVDDVLMRLAPTKHVVIYGGIEEGLDLRNLESLEACEDACSHIGPTIHTPLPPVSSIQPPPEFQSLGDINGDGIEDIGYTRLGEEARSLAIVYGSPALKWDDTIEIGETPTPHTSIVDGASEINDVGDVNGDGLGDVLIGPWGSCCNWSNNFVTESAHLLHGSSVFEPNTRTSLDELLASDPLSQAHGKVERPASVGDFNGDGYADYIFESIGGQWDSRQGIELFFGSDRDQLTSATIPDTDRNGMTGRRVFEAADDFNGDGFSDLLFSFTGSDCDCGASGRPHVTGGLQVVYGRPHDPSGNSARIDAARTVFLLDRESPYLEALKSGSATFMNVDGDQFADIGFTPERIWGADGLIVIRGSATPKKIDFGHVADGIAGFDGHAVYGFHDVRLPFNSNFDLNGDGITDFLRQRRVIIGNRPTSVFVAGDVDQNILVDAGRSVTYEVTGTVKHNATDIDTTVYATVEIEPLFANNVVSPREGVFLNVEIAELETEGNQVELDISITNRGPHNARGVQLSETLTDGLTDVTWHRTVQLFPDEIQLGSLDPGVGTSLVGAQPDVGLFVGNLESYLSDTQLQRYFGTSAVYGSLGERVGSAGDLNSDGYDDIFVDVITGLRRERQQSLLFYGSPEFAESGFESPDPRPVIRARTSRLGDLNNDGFDDRIQVAGVNGVDFHSTQVIFGGPIIDGEQQVQGVLQFVFPIDGWGASPTATTGFDVNGDGVEDLLIGNENRGLFERYIQGAAYLIFGRSLPNSEGTGAIVDTLDVPVGSTVTYTIRGTKQSNAALSGKAELHVDESQIDLESQVKVATLGPLTIPGDIDQDGTVGFSDFLILSANFGHSPRDHDRGDLNGDQTVDLDDFLILSRNFGSSTPLVHAYERSLGQHEVG